LQDQPFAINPLTELLKFDHPIFYTKIEQNQAFLEPTGFDTAFAKKKKLDLMFVEYYPIGLVGITNCGDFT
jgi:hypothetical protein